MRKNFNVTEYRFHAKDESVLLIRGWFNDSKSEEKALSVSLDKEELEVETEQCIYIAPSQSAKERQYKRVILKVRLPEGWKSHKSITVWNREMSEKKKVITLSTARLSILQKKMICNIENIVWDKTGFHVFGWCLAIHPVEFKITDSKGKKIECELKKTRWLSTTQRYPECNIEDMMGFEIYHQGTDISDIEVKVKSERKTVTYNLLLKQSKMDKMVKKIQKYSEKGWRFYKEYGAIAALEKCKDKLVNKSSKDYKKWLQERQPSKQMLEKQRKHEFLYNPKISIVIPLYKTPEKYLKELIDSVCNQTYANWELCFSDGSGVETSLRKIIKEYQKKESRIKMVSSTEPLQISENTNTALKIATGDFIAFADHDDLLTPNALYENVKVLNKNAYIDFIYSDEDKISMDGKEYFEPHFKPDFNLDLLRTTNYICHFVVVRKTIVDDIGGLKSEFDGAQDFDFVLRCVERTSNIYHIPKILYHWRAHKDSTAENPASKMYAFENGEKALQSYYERNRIDVRVEMRRDYLGIYHSIYHLKEKPLVSIIIPNKDHIRDLEKCINSIEEKSTYQNLEYIIIENNSTEEETFEYYEKLQQENIKAKVVVWEDEFNYSAINNYGVTFANGEYLLFLNNDTEIINENCIEEMLGYCMREDVGIVGARLYYSDDTIQHAGVVLGMGGVAGHCFVNMPKEQPGYFARVLCAQDYSAVTAACMMVKRSVYEKVKGFDEQLKVAYNDIDFCLKVRREGFLVVYNPYVELYHYESKSRGLENTEEKVRRFKRESQIFKERWGVILEKGDPYYNPNLTLDKNDFSLR